MDLGRQLESVAHQERATELRICTGHGIHFRTTTR
jgi:hypothetical protein